MRVIMTTILIIICTSLLVLEIHSLLIRPDLRDKMDKYPSNELTDFADLVLNHRKFIDKSLLIKDFLLTDQTYVVTRPKGWGKSLNMNMLKVFLQVRFDKDGVRRPKNINRKLFEGGCFMTGRNKTRCLKPLKIAQQYPEIVEQHQGKYPVIEFSIKRKLRLNYAMTRRIINKKLKSMFYEEFAFLEKYFGGDTTLKGCDVDKLKAYMEGQDDQIDPKDGFTLLTEALGAHFEAPVYVFVDDYDRLLRRDKIRDDDSSHENAIESVRREYFQQVRTLMGTIYSDLFKDTKTVRGVLTGISIVPYREISMDFDVSGIKEDTVWEPVFADHYGFNEEEVNSLLLNSPLTLRSRDVKHWYKGYQIDGNIMYASISIIQSLYYEDIDSYWIQTAIGQDTDAINHLISDKIKDEMCTLMYSNTQITARVPKKVTHFVRGKERREEMLTSLLMQGYLTAVRVSKNHYNFSTPNHEIREFMFYQIISLWLENQLQLHSRQWKDWYWVKTEFAKTLTLYRMEELEADLTDALRWPSLLHNNTDEEVIEKFYENVMTLLLFPASEHYDVKREYLPQNNVVFTLTPATSDGEKQNAIIMGYTCDINDESLVSISKEILRRVYESSYHQNMKTNTFVKKIYCIGIAIRKDEADVQFVAEENPYYHPAERVIEKKS